MNTLLNNEEKVNGKAAYVLSINDNINELVIKNAREQIAILEGQVSQKMPDFNTKRDFHREALREFEEAKLELDKIYETIEEQKSLIDVFNGFKEKPGSKIMQVRSNTISPDQPPRQRSPRVVRVNWIAESMVVLKLQNKFMTASELFEEIYKKPHIIEALQGTKAGQFKNSTKQSFIINITKSANRNFGDSNREQFIKAHEDKIGLVKWFDKNGIIQPNYLKEFMYHEQN